MPFHSQAAISTYSAIRIHRQTGCRQPGRALASCAEKTGSVMVALVVDQGDVGLLQHLLEGWIQLSAALLQLQGSLRPAASQC